MVGGVWWGEAAAFGRLFTVGCFAERYTKSLLLICEGTAQHHRNGGVGGHLGGASSVRSSAFGRFEPLSAGSACSVHEGGVLFLHARVVRSPVWGIIRYMWWEEGEGPEATGEGAVILFDSDSCMCLELNSLCCCATFTCVYGEVIKLRISCVTDSRAEHGSGEHEARPLTRKQGAGAELVGVHHVTCACVAVPQVVVRWCINIAEEGEEGGFGGRHLSEFVGSPAVPLTKPGCYHGIKFIHGRYRGVWG